MALSRVSVDTLSLERPEAGRSHLQVYCIDNTEYALRSEDYPIDRLHFQQSALQIINKSLGLCNQAPWLYAAIRNGAKVPEFVVPPTSDDTGLLKSAALRDEGPQDHKLVQSLKVAALACKQYASAQLLAWIASPICLTPEARQQLVQHLSAADVRLDLLQLCSDRELGQSVVTELENLIVGLNSSPSLVRDGTGNDVLSENAPDDGVMAAPTTAAAAARSRPSRLIKLQPPGLDIPEWQQHEQLLELLEFPSSNQGALHPSDTSIPCAALPAAAAAVGPNCPGSLQESVPWLPGQPATAGASSAGAADPAVALPAHALAPTQTAAAAAPVAAAPVSGTLATVAAARPAAAAGVPSSGFPSTTQVSGSRMARGTRAASVAGPPPRVTSARPGRGLANLFSSPSVFLSRAMTPSLCRYESMDALQHLSPEGFIHSWLPSYSNPSKVLPPLRGAGLAGDYCFLALKGAGGSNWQVLLSVPAGLCRVQAIKPAANRGHGSSSSGGDTWGRSALVARTQEEEQQREPEALGLAAIAGTGNSTKEEHRLKPEVAAVLAEGDRQKNGEAVGKGAAEEEGRPLSAAAAPPVGAAAAGALGVAAEGHQAAPEIAVAVAGDTRLAPVQLQAANPMTAGVSAAGGAQIAAAAASTVSAESVAIDGANQAASGGVGSGSTAICSAPCKTQRMWRVEPQPEPGQLLLMVNTTKWGHLRLVWRPQPPKPAPVKTAVEAAAALAAGGKSIWDVGGGQGAGMEVQEEAGFVWEVDAEHTTFAEWVSGAQRGKGASREEEQKAGGVFDGGESGSVACCGADLPAAAADTAEGQAAMEGFGGDNTGAVVAGKGVSPVEDGPVAAARPGAFLMVQGAVRGTLARIGEESSLGLPGSHSSSSRRRSASSSQRSSGNTGGSRRVPGASSNSGSIGGGGGISGAGSDSGDHSSSGEGPSSSSSSSTGGKRMQSNDSVRMAVVSAAMAAKEGSKVSSSNQPAAPAAAPGRGPSSSAAAAAAGAALPLFFYLQQPGDGGGNTAVSGGVEGLAKLLEQLVKTVPSKGPPRASSSSSSSSQGQQKQHRLLSSQLLQQAGGTILKLGPLPLAQVQEWLRSSSLTVAGGPMGGHLLRLALPKPLLSSGSVEVGAVRYLTAEGKKAALAQQQQEGQGQRQQQGLQQQQQEWLLGQGQGLQKELGGFAMRRTSALPQRIILKRRDGTDGSDVLGFGPPFTVIRVGSAPSVLVSGNSSSSRLRSRADMVGLAAPGGLMMARPEEGFDGRGRGSSSSSSRMAGSRGQIVPLAERVQSHPLFSRLRLNRGAAGDVVGAGTDRDSRNLATGADGGGGGALQPRESSFRRGVGADLVEGIAGDANTDGAGGSVAVDGGGASGDSGRGGLSKADGGDVIGSKRPVAAQGLGPIKYLQEALEAAGVAAGAAPAGATSSSSATTATAGWAPMQKKMGFGSLSSGGSIAGHGSSSTVGDGGSGLGVRPAAAVLFEGYTSTADSNPPGGFGASGEMHSPVHFGRDVPAAAFHVADLELAEHGSDRYSFGAASDHLHPHNLHHGLHDEDGSCLDDHDEMPDQAGDNGHGGQAATAAAGGVKRQQAPLSVSPAMVALAPADSDASGIEDTLLFELE